MRATNVLAVLALTAAVVHAEQAPFAARVTKKKALKGRFLHLTDFHPDPHYVTGGTFDSGCHRRDDSGKDKKGKGKATAEDEDDFGKEAGAGRWGSAVSDCDTPMTLVDHTFDWLKREWADEVDFVVWTGDNARHDIDRSIPRTPKEIFSSNQMMVDKMLATFGKDMPIVPSIGNNDIYPHNVLAKGPNTITENFLRIWKHFIPDDNRHVFERGAYFSVEVVPDRLAVMSLNTLFWYDSNTLVDGCQDHSHDPGSLHMDWLEVQLQNYRDRGMQVWLTGHVPPHMGHYFDTCYLRYGDLALRYQDTIVGHLFGHMNIDHFFFIDVQELESTGDSDKSKSQKLRRAREQARLVDGTTADPAVGNVSFFGPAIQHGGHLGQSGRYGVLGRSGNNDLKDELKKDFGEMPGPQKLKLQDYAVMNVAPSVIPTYLPGVRVYSYNVSGVEYDDLAGAAMPDALEALKKKRRGGHRHDKPKDDCSKPENEDKPHCTFKHKPRYYSKHSPSRRNGPLTPLGYAQFYMPALDRQSREPPPWVIEYTTYKARSLLPSNLTRGGGAGGDAQALPVPLHLLPAYDADMFRGLGADDFVFHDSANDDDDEGGVAGDAFDAAAGSALDVDADTAGKKRKFKKEIQRITPWHMKDLTIGSYVKLARKLVAEKKMWSKFTEYMYVSSDSN